jgi:hypothetical protein
MYRDEALTESEITTIFNNANAYDFLSDNRIILSVATPTTAGTSKALSITGTGYFRNLNRTASLEPVTLGGPAGTVSITNGFSAASHIFYGEDVEELFLNGIISTGTNLATSTQYRILGLKNTFSNGYVAYAVKI